MRVLTVFLVSGLTLENAYQPSYERNLRISAFGDEESCLCLCGFAFCSFLLDIPLLAPFV